MENVIVVFPKIEDAKNIRNVLVRNGIEVDAVCTSGAQALEYANNIEEGLVICSYRFTDMYYAQLKEDLPKGFDMLLVASQSHWDDHEDIMKIGTPLKLHDLINTVHMMFEAQRRRRKKLHSQPQQRSAQEEKLIREAKGLLMDRNRLTESEAHKYLQKCSMDSGNSLVETAKMVICLYRD